MMRSLRPLLSLALLCAPALPARAETPRCIEGEFVLSESVHAKRAKAVSDIEQVSGTPLGVAEETSHFVLVAPANNLVPDPKAVAYDAAKDLCERLKRAQRGARLSNRKSHTHAVVRRYSCSCNGVFSAELHPNDPLYTYQTEFTNGMMGIESAWNFSTGSPAVAVGIIDTGVDYTHPDLTANMWRNPGEIAGNGIDDDHDGVVDDVYGYNAVSDNGNPMDDAGHGTHVAGTIGAFGSNAVGVVGINWQTRIIAAKFLDSTGNGTLANAVKAIDYLTMLKQRGINIVLSNNSWGGGGYYQPLADAIQRSNQAGMLFVAAAGNASLNVETSPSYPGSYTLDGIISVAAVDDNAQLASFSNYGARSVDLAAPGVNTASTYPGNRYVYMSGTSMAAPHVSGALALLKAYSSLLSAQELKQRLLASVTTTSGLTGVVLTGGYLNVQRMLAEAPSNPAGNVPADDPRYGPTPTPTVTPTATPTITPTATPAPTPGIFRLTGAASYNGQGLGGVKLTLHTAAGDTVKFSASDGSFDFGGINGPIAYTLTPEKAGYTFAVVNGYLTSDVFQALTAQARTFTLQIKVYAASGGALLAGTTISAGAAGSAVTDVNGLASFVLPYGTNYSLSAAAGGYLFDQGAIGGILRGDTTRVFMAQAAP